MASSQATLLNLGSMKDGVPSTHDEDAGAKKQAEAIYVILAALPTLLIIC